MKILNADLAMDVQILREKLIQLGSWPEAGDQFLALMPRNWTSPLPTERDLQLLPHVAGDAIIGSDIGARYPSFFQKLMTQPRLRRDFLDELQRRLH